jgi:hypothetical protein
MQSRVSSTIRNVPTLTPLEMSPWVLFKRDRKRHVSWVYIGGSPTQPGELYPPGMRYSPWMILFRQHSPTRCSTRIAPTCSRWAMARSRWCATACPRIHPRRQAMRTCRSLSRASHRRGGSERIVIAITGCCSNQAAGYRYEGARSAVHHDFRLTYDRPFCIRTRLHCGRQ